MCASFALVLCNKWVFLGTWLSVQSGAVGKVLCSHFSLSRESSTIREKWLNLFLCSIFTHFSWSGSACAPSTLWSVRVLYADSDVGMYTGQHGCSSHYIAAYACSAEAFLSNVKLFFCASLCSFSRRWYALRMSGVGENSSDPGRAESRKRKECSAELLGPRYLVPLGVMFLTFLRVFAVYS